MKKVLVCHPGLQHSHQLAWALHEHGLLSAYWSGVPVKSAEEKKPFWLPSELANKLRIVNIPPTLRRHPILFQILLRLSSKLPDCFYKLDLSHRIFHLYDWWMSKKIAKLKPEVVIAYENSAYRTFLAAKKIGALCILDAASLHHVAGSKLMDVQQTGYISTVNKIKDAEVELADLIITCSPFAADSYIENGVPASKVKSVLLGAELPSNVESWSAHYKPIHFLFAGALSYRKSIDIILDAFKRLHEEGIPYQLTFVGGEGEAGWVNKVTQTPNTTYLGNQPQIELYKQLSNADCLLLPSRFDSFGMVVAEALACGTPAIVSTFTGAKGIIELHPDAGWIIEPETEALYHCIKARIENRDALFNARKFAHQAAKDFTWQSYRQRVATLISDWICNAQHG